MKLSEIASKAGLKSLNEHKDNDVEGVYISDIVSDIITVSKPKALLITLQTHKNLIAAANLVDVAAIVFAKGKMPAADTIELANKPGIGLFASEADTWSIASRLFALGLR